MDLKNILSVIYSSPPVLVLPTSSLVKFFLHNIHVPLSPSQELLLPLLHGPFLRIWFLQLLQIISSHLKPGSTNERVGIGQGR